MPNTKTAQPLSPHTLALDPNLPNLDESEIAAPITANDWHDWRNFTQARIALGRAGAALPTTEILDFGLSHAAAQDAIYTPLDTERLAHALATISIPSYAVTSQVKDRHEYLRRPDLGRQLNPDTWQQWAVDSQQWLASVPPCVDEDYDVAFVAADGLSSLAIERHFVPFLSAFFVQNHPAWKIAPVVIATQARVALGDSIGEHLRTKIMVVCIGERPGLSSPDSMGIYLTFSPKIGKHDAQRNCISNVRPQGLNYTNAAHKLAWLIQKGLQLQMTGVNLKDESDTLLVEGITPDKTLK